MRNAPFPGEWTQNACAIDSLRRLIHQHTANGDRLINANTAARRSVPRRGAGGSALACGGSALVVLLVGLASSLRLGLTGWAAGLGYAVGLLVVLGWMTAAHRHRFGAADWITLARAVLTGGVLALTADRFAASPGGPRDQSAPVFAVWLGLAIVALALDALDGPVGRRTATTSAFGARFDMEVDAFLILVLSVALVPGVGRWVLAIGGMRYVFVLLTRVFPRLATPLPPSVFRKAVAAVQGILLLLAAGAVRLTPVPTLGITLTALALALLSLSFARDIGWLIRHGKTAARARC